MYRIYAKIIGYILPQDSTNIGKCIIKEMSQTEQNSRDFKPFPARMSSMVERSEYSSYLMPVGFIDSRLIKTNYVAFTDIETSRSNEAIGKAIVRFDKLVASLGLGSSDWFERTHNRFDFKPCDYQISKVYKLNGEIEEEIDEEVFIGGSVSQINLPTSTPIDEDMDKLVKKIAKSDFYIINKSIGYFLEAKRMMNEGIPLDKVVLDLTKSIEIFTRIFSGKSFPKRLDIMAKTIGLNQEDKIRIIKLWKTRSDDDVAHADMFDRIAYLPPQFPIPSRTTLPMGAFSVCAKTIIRFFNFFDGLVEVKVRRDTNIGGVNEITRVDNKDLFVFYSPIQNKRKLTPLIKKKLAESLDKKVSDITMVQNTFPEFLFKIKDYKREDFRGRNLIRIFGNAGL